jgi:acylphosphatase
METKTVSINLYGRVQQVGFRYFVFRLAAEVGVLGFVKNLSDGSVYVEAEGEPSLVDIFIEHCKKGPPQSLVTKFMVNLIPPRGFDEFTIR